MTVKVEVWLWVAMVGTFFLVWLKREHDASRSEQRRAAALEKK